MFRIPLLRRWLSWLLATCWMVVLFLMSGQDAGESSSLSGSFIDVLASIFDASYVQLSITEKVLIIAQLQGLVRIFAHFMAYCLLGIFVSASVQTLDLRFCGKLFFSFAVCLLYAISDELHQSYVPGRSMQLSDILVDSLGALTGFFIVLGIVYFLNILNKERMNAVCHKEKDRF